MRCKNKFPILLFMVLQLQTAIKMSKTEEFFQKGVLRYNFPSSIDIFPQNQALKFQIFTNKTFRFNSSHSIQFNSKNNNTTQREK